MRTTLLLVLAVAVWFDLRERRIPNLLVLVALCFGFALSAATNGMDGIGISLAGTLLGVALLVPFFVLGVLGAGDAKLFGAVGSLVGYHALWDVWLYTLISGGVIAMLSVLAVRSFSRLSENMKILAFALFYGGNFGIASSADAFAPSAKVPYAVAIAVGVLIWMVRQS